jgi:CBS domain-containing protein
MTVESILREKGTTMICVTPDTSIREATQILNEHQIGAVLVTSGDTLLGVLSERAIVRALGSYDGDVRVLRADTVMKPRQFDVGRSASLQEAMRMMTDNRVRYLPVRENGGLVGLISIGDIVRAELKRRAYEVDHLTAYIGGAT